MLPELIQILDFLMIFMLPEMIQILDRRRSFDFIVCKGEFILGGRLEYGRENRRRYLPGLLSRGSQEAQEFRSEYVRGFLLLLDVYVVFCF